MFQREMMNVFGQLEGVEVVVDDLVHRKYTEEHNRRRRIKVLKTVRKYNIKLNKDKCKIGQDSVVYVGHMITAEGLKPTEEETGWEINKNLFFRLREFLL